MGTTDNFDTTAATTAVATSTMPVLLTSNAGSRSHTLDMLQAFNGRFRYCTITGNLGTLSSLGTSTTPVAGTVYYADVFIPETAKVLTGVGVLNAATVGTNKWVVGLFDSSGALLANSALAGATTSGANAFQQVAFTATYTVKKPGRYWIGVQLDGTTDRFRTIAAATWIDVLTTSATGTFGTLAALTPPTTFTADVGPIAYVY
jgi:hypothetical protein